MPLELATKHGLGKEADGELARPPSTRTGRSQKQPTTGTGAACQSTRVSVYALRARERRRRENRG